MFEDNEWAILVAKLRDLTRNNKLEWSSQSGEDVATVGGYEYSIGSVDNDDRQPFYLEIRRDFVTLDRLVSEPITPSGDPWTEDAPQNAAQALLDLKALASRSALRTEVVFEEMLTALNRLDSELDPGF